MTELADNSSFLPKGWAFAKFIEVVYNESLAGKKLKQSEYKEKGKIPVIDQGQNFVGGYTDKREYKVDINTPVIIFGDHTKVIKYVDFPFVAGADGVKVLVPSEVFFPKLLYYFLKALKLPEKGYARHYQYLKKSILPIPPLQEQYRISSKIEEVFSFLDEGAESLRKVQVQLKRYRQAVLKHAFEGKLTEEWRKTTKDRRDQIRNVIEEIRQEKISGKFNRCKKLISLEVSELPELPEEWVWTSLNDLAENTPNSIKAGPFGSTLKKAFYVSKGYKIYGQEQVLRGDPFFGDYYINKELFEKMKSYSVNPGDILISLVGTIGKVLILPEGIEEGIINPRLVRFSLDKRAIDPKYVQYYFLSSMTRHYFSISSHGGTMDILNLAILKSLPLALPSLAEQKIIIQELERAFSLSIEAEKSINSNFIRAERLRQSILKEAFKGRLVPHDPNDEPVEILLERIKAKHMGKKSAANQLELSNYVK